MSTNNDRRMAEYLVREIEKMEVENKSLRCCGNCDHFPSSNPKWNVRVICIGADGEELCDDWEKRNAELLEQVEVLKRAND